MGEKIRTNSLGQTECIDEETGKVLWVQKKKKTYKDGAVRKLGRPRGRHRDDNTHHWLVDGDGKKHWVRKGTNADDLPRQEWVYSETLIRQICGLITTGETVNSIAKIEGFPSAVVIHSWTRKYPEFKEELRLAREARAEYYHDEIMELVKNTSEWNAKSMRVKMAALQWGAEVGDREKFGRRTVIAGDLNAPVALLIDTGIRRDSDEGALDVTPQKLLEESQ